MATEQIDSSNHVPSPDIKFRNMRGWADGESMRPHVMAEQTTFDAAIKYRNRHGGYIERTCDGILFVDGNWIDPQTGEEVSPDN